MIFISTSSRPVRVAAAAALVLLAGACFTACLETDQTITINPDGSGKMRLHVIQPDMLAMFSIDTKETSKREEELRKAQQNLRPILDSPGIEAWRDVTFRTLPDGRIEFRGTGYFRSLDAVKIQGNAGSPLQMISRNGVATIIMRPEPTVNDGTSLPDSTIDESEIARRADSLRQSYMATRPMMVEMMNGFRQHVTLELPAAAVRSEGWRINQNRRRAEFAIDGSRLLVALDTLVGRHGFWDDQVRNGNRPPENLIREVFGADSVLVSFPLSGAQQFDYAREVAVARRQTAALRKRYKLNDQAAGETPNRSDREGE